MNKPEIKLASILQDLIECKGMTYRGLAKKTGVSTSTIFNWTTGAIPRSIFHLKAVADFLQVDLSYLLFGESGEDQEHLRKAPAKRFKVSIEIILTEQGTFIEKLELSKPKES